jgi:hypothetical protein
MRPIGLDAEAEAEAEPEPEGSLASPTPVTFPDAGPGSKLLAMVGNCTHLSTSAHTGGLDGVEEAASGV